MLKYEPMDGTHRDLEVYQLAHKIGVAAHILSLRLPRYEMNETGSQLRRAAKSVSANIVEGYGRRRYKSDFIKFLIYALSSCDETGEHLLYIRDCHPEFARDAQELEIKNHELARRLNRFLQSVIEKHNAPR